MKKSNSGNTMAKKRETEPKIKMYRLERQKGSVDNVFFVLVILLLCIGSVMVLSASYYVANSKFKDSFYFARHQLIYAALAIAVMIVIAKWVDYRWLRKLVWWVMLGSIFMCLIILLMPSSMTHTANNATRWIKIGPITFQPSELVKLSVILVLADYMSKRKTYMHKFVPGLLVPGMVIALCCIIVIIQPHVSGAIIIGLIGLGMMLMGGTNLVQLGSIFAAGVATLYFGYNVIKDQTWFVEKFNHVIKRLAVWQDPFAKEHFTGDGWQPAQSLLAISSGGFWGVGLGRSIQKHGYLPEPQNDYIFSIVCEELGFFGAIVILILFALLIIRGFKIGAKAPDTFSSLVVYGIMIKLAVQVGLNLLVVTNTIPSTGISLPFFSYGGTSLILQIAEMGIVLMISKFSYQEK